MKKLFAVADAHFAAQRYSEAAAAYTQILAKYPNYAAAHCNYAATLVKLGQIQKALDHLERALEIDPKHESALNNLAVMRGRLGQHEAAVALCRRLVEIDPQDPDYHHNLGAMLYQSKRKTEAVQCFEAVLKLNPDYYESLMALAEYEFSRGNRDQGLAYLQRLRVKNSHRAEFWVACCFSGLPMLSRSVEESAAALQACDAHIAELAEWVAQKPEHLRRLGQVVGADMPFLLAYRWGNHRERLSRVGEILTRAARAEWLVRYPALREFEQRVTATHAQHNSRKIRLAIVSGHVRRHSVWDIILKGLIKHLDRRKFEIFVYYNGDGRDEETSWAEAVSTQFVHEKKGDGEWLELIAAAQPDVIFMPEIGMSPMTVKLAALRLAPVQAVSWGHPITTGFPNVDIFFSGELIESEQADAHYSERLVRLPNTGACTEMLDHIEAQPLSPDILPIPSDENVLRVLIAQRPFKFDPQDDALIVNAVAAAMPCRLYVVRDVEHTWATDALFARWKPIFAAKGLDLDAIVTEVPWLERGQFFGLLDQMDIYLDLPTFSGYTTAWQALHRGLPVITLEGEWMRQRLAAGLLRQAELTSWVTHSPEEYVQAVTSLASTLRKPSFRQFLREGVKIAAQKVDHDVSVVRGFETALIDALAEKGRQFDVATLTGEPEPAPKVEARPVTPKVDYAWQWLDVGSHVEVLSHDYAPVGLLTMLKSAHTERNQSLHILDVGCFCGGSGRWLKQNLWRPRLTGIEMLPEAAKIAARTYDRVINKKFEEIDFDAEGLTAGSVDLMVAADVLEHMYHPWQALQRLRPLLAPGGELFISLPNARNLRVSAGLMRGEWPYAKAGILDITHIRFFTLKEARAMLAQTGWELKDLRCNPDPSLKKIYEGRDLNQIKTLELPNMTLKNLTHDDLVELTTLQFFMRVTPKSV